MDRFLRQKTPQMILLGFQPRQVVVHKVVGEMEVVAQNVANQRLLDARQEQRTLDVEAMIAMCDGFEERCFDDTTCQAVDRAYRAVSRRVGKSWKDAMPLPELPVIALWAAQRRVARLERHLAGLYADAAQSQWNHGALTSDEGRA